MSQKIDSPRRGVMAETIPVRINEDDRRLLDLAARLAGMKVSTFLRHAGVETAKNRLLNLGGGA